MATSISSPDGLGRGQGPWVPVLEGDSLYGRGDADDGYDVYALSALLALKAQGVARTSAR
ncbi:MAG: hypothetical protein R3C30_06265 [Hyphomonadaceae bacterium]